MIFQYKSVLKVPRDILILKTFSSFTQNSNLTEHLYFCLQNLTTLPATVYVGLKLREQGLDRGVSLTIVSIEQHLKYQK